MIDATAANSLMDTSTPAERGARMSRVRARDTLPGPHRSRGASALQQGHGPPRQAQFGDCFAYALAKERNEPLLLVDQDVVLADI
jgi:uncharacterized protein with PIN domain